MDLSGLTDAITSEIQSQGADVNVDSTKATATNTPGGDSGDGAEVKEGDAKADPKNTATPDGKDTDKKSTEEGDKTPTDEKGQPLSDKELDEFKKLWKHYVAYPKYAKSQERTRQLEAEIAQLKAQKSPQWEDEEAVKAREELKKMGFIPQDEIEQITKQKELEQAQVAETEAFKESIKALEDKYDGTLAGLPKFQIQELQDFMQNENVYNPEGAYILKNLDAYINHMVEQEIKARADVPAPTKIGSTQKPSGQELDLSKVNIGDDSFRDAISSMLKG